MSDLMGKISDAVRDLRYLLNQGYPRDSAVNFVANHYRLPLNQRHLLARCVFSRLTRQAANPSYRVCWRASTTPGRGRRIFGCWRNSFGAECKPATGSNSTVA